jgi:hypothetical protein
MAVAVAVAVAVVAAVAVAAAVVVAVVVAVAQPQIQPQPQPQPHQRVRLRTQLGFLLALHQRFRKTLRRCHRPRKFRVDVQTPTQIRHSLLRGEHASGTR